MSRGLKLVCCIAVWLTISSASLVAQVSVNGSLSGRVTDQNGAAIAGAVITLINMESSQQKVATTSDEGDYSFPRLAPGVYRLRVERQGFGTLQRDGIHINVNDAAAIDVTLQVGAVSETIDVTSGDQVTQTQSSNISQIIETRPIEDLPLNSRDFQKLTFLAPGVGGQRGNNSAPL